MEFLSFPLAVKSGNSSLFLGAAAQDWRMDERMESWNSFSSPLILGPYCLREAIEGTKSSRFDSGTLIFDLVKKEPIVCGRFPTDIYWQLHHIYKQCISYFYSLALKIWALEASDRRLESEIRNAQPTNNAAFAGTDAACQSRAGRTEAFFCLADNTLPDANSMVICVFDNLDLLDIKCLDIVSI